ncbi:2-amino-4-hydroxy-6-hydroxymethyldihydropteridine diphosphokinase [Paracoccus sp. PARArs4]|uniref:2-amino-4-hydroxy-6- hydroxymethyldihydropteridine diphosphokinase n=1 Tax=Paracoccus sp. PARArs4 TaxID=2853442 RepID=UPI0024A68D17|nr:2-amino-4-hydroxy-6-hydroxymethyldihydropteridine diphosphokinase [Paracoccus sp. PARArs4]
MVNLSFGIVALGANLPLSGQELWAGLRRTLDILHSEPGISISASSRFWRSPAIPLGSGPDYVNAAATFTTPLPPEDVLAAFHRIEADFGRDRSTGRWSSRVLDLDLIALDDRIVPDRTTLRHWIDLPFDSQTRVAPDRLLLPHPRMQDRGFVLAPLAEIAPDWRHPLTGLTVQAMLDALPPSALDGMTPMDPSEMAGPA